jgi:hypothetical protein
MWLKKQHYKVHTRFGGQIQGRFRLYIFRASYIAEHGLPRKHVDFYRSPGFSPSHWLHEVCISKTVHYNFHPEHN